MSYWRIKNTGYDKYWLQYRVLFFFWATVRDYDINYSYKREYPTPEAAAKAMQAIEEQEDKHEAAKKEVIYL
jgi:uncharacterized protein with von Willebrand factor type A (vWA) domain